MSSTPQDQAPPAPPPQPSPLDAEIAEFFTQTNVTREECDAFVSRLFPSARHAPSPTQGSCSYTVFVGGDSGDGPDGPVLQFRLKSLALPTETAVLAREAYGDYAPTTEFLQQLGKEDTLESDGGPRKEPFLVYMMTRIGGVPYIEFLMAHGYPRASPENVARRATLVQTLAKFFARAWPSSSPSCSSPPPDTVGRLRETYTSDLALLDAALPTRFRPVIAAVQAALPSILSLPIVLVHNDVSHFNVHVAPPSPESSISSPPSLGGFLVGLVDWAEAALAPFGTNFRSLDTFIADLNLRDGWVRPAEYDSLVALFWDTLASEVVGGGKDTDGAFAQKLPAIKMARILGLLRATGFTCRLANMPEAPRPVRDNESGRYALMILDGLLTNPATRYRDLESV